VLRFPIRDIVPTRTRPIVTTLLALVLLAGQVRLDTSITDVLLLAAQLLPLMVLGETVEDQFGRWRYLGLLALGVMVGAWLDRPALSDVTWCLYPTAAVLGAHVSRFPLSRVAVSVRFALLEVPAFVLIGTWLVTVVLTVTPGRQGMPLAGTLGAIVIGAALARWAVPASRRSWDYLDTLR
jgi:membrane associated rhomboid family serine protease